MESKCPYDTLHMHRMIWICNFCTCWKALFVTPAVCSRDNRPASFRQSIRPFVNIYSRYFWAELLLREHFFFTGCFEFFFPGTRICTWFGYTVDSRYLELQGTLWNTSRYPYFDISDLRNWGRQSIEQPLLTEWICNLTPKLEIYWKYCGKEEKLLLRSNFSSFPQYFVACW